MGIIAYSSPFVQGEGKGKQRCRIQNNGYVACLTRETCERLFSSGQACANTVARLNALNNSKYHLTFVIYPTTRPHTLATPFPDIRTTNENRNCSPGAAPAYTSQILVHRVPVRHCQSAHFYQLSSKLRHLVLNTKLASSLPVFPSIRTKSISHSSLCFPRANLDTFFVACSSPPQRQMPRTQPLQRSYPRVPACARSRRNGVLIRPWPKVTESTGRYSRLPPQSSGITRSSTMGDFFRIFCWICWLTEERLCCWVGFIEIHARAWGDYYQWEDRQA